MQIRAFTTVAVRILGLVALLKGGMACVNVIMLLCSLLLATARPSGRVVAVQCLGVALNSLVPLIAGIVCLACSKPLAELLIKGLGESCESGTAKCPASEPAS